MLLASLLIRSATDQDMLGLLSIKPDEPLHRERLEQQCHGAVSYLIAGNTSHPVLGYVVLRWGGDEQHSEYPALQDLLVRSDYRSQSIGTRLLERAELLTRERGFSRLGLSVNPTDNPRAKQLYERLGYIETGEPIYCHIYSVVDEQGEQRLYEDSCLSMVKTL